MPIANRAGRNAEREASLGHFFRCPRAAELFERHAQIDHLGALGRNQPRARVVKSAVDCETAIAMSVAGASSAVGDLLEPGRIGEVGVLVNDNRDVTNRCREPPESARAIAVQVDDVGLSPIELLQESRQRRRVELRPVHIRDVDPQFVERIVREVALAQADERHVEPRAIEARNHPREEALDAVHARPGPTEVIADMNDVEGTAHNKPWARYQTAVR